MSAMLSRASTISFDPVVHQQRAQFNSSTGSWVFGLAAFAAGVALKNMMKSGAGASGASRISAPAHHAGGSSSIKALLRDTMEEEGRSGDYLSSISSEVAKLREEVASLSAQKELLKVSSDDLSPMGGSDEYTQLLERLDQINAEKVRLSQTEALLQQNLMTQESNVSAPSEALLGDLQRVQN